MLEVSLAGTIMEACVSRLDRAARAAAATFFARHSIPTLANSSLSLDIRALLLIQANMRPAQTQWIILSL